MYIAVHTWSSIDIHLVGVSIIIIVHCIVKWTLNNVKLFTYPCPHSFISIHFIFSPMRMRTYWIFWNLLRLSEIKLCVPNVGRFATETQMGGGKRTGIEGWRTNGKWKGVEQSILMRVGRWQISSRWLLSFLDCIFFSFFLHQLWCVLKFYLLCSISIVRIYKVSESRY